MRVRAGGSVLNAMFIHVNEQHSPDGFSGGHSDHWVETGYEGNRDRGQEASEVLWSLDLCGGGEAGWHWEAELDTVAGRLAGSGHGKGNRGGGLNNRVDGDAV